MRRSTRFVKAKAMGFSIPVHNRFSHLFRMGESLERKMQMNNRSFVRCVLILGLAGAIGFPALNAFAQTQAASPQPASHKVVAFYFHTNTRCSTCIKIEAYSHEAIEKGFPDELKNGTLELRVVNYEQPENRHFIQDYRLVSKSLILAPFVFVGGCSDCVKRGGEEQARNAGRSQAGSRRFVDAL